MPLSQFLLREVTAEHDLDTPEGRAHVQFDAKPLLQAMTPSRCACRSCAAWPA
jgi:DNA primase